MTPNNKIIIKYLKEWRKEMKPEYRYSIRTKYWYSANMIRFISDELRDRISILEWEVKNANRR